MSRIGTFFFTKPDGELDAVSFLVFLGVTLGVVHLVGAVGLVEPEANLLIEGDALSESMDGDETTPLLVQSEQSGSLKSFLTDPEMYIFGLLLAFSVGPAEAIQASLGSVVESLLPESNLKLINSQWPSETALQIRSRHIQILAVCNTLSRLAAGAISDALCPGASGHSKSKPSRLFFLALVTGQYAIALLWAGGKLGSTSQLYVISIPTGIALGGVFSIAPTIVAKKWQFKHFGRNFGLIILFAACGMLCFSPSDLLAL